MADLITLEQLKIAEGIQAGDTDEARDKRYEQAIKGASAAIRKYADRAFGIEAKAGTRTYEYDGSGYVDIDDAMTVTEVTFIFGTLETPLSSFYWRPEPQEGPPYSYLTIPHWAGIYSPEMGFTYNLDVISKDRGWPGLIPLVKVVGEFGWPEVPSDVQQACIITAGALSEKPTAHASERIASYSWAQSIRGDLTDVTAIPARAMDLLEPYIRMKI